MNVNAYLNFPGQSEAAFTFYAAALGATLGEIHRFGGMPGGDKLPADQQNRVMHMSLTLPSGQVLMTSDTIDGMGPAPVTGTNFSLSIHPDSREQADAIFAALAEGGTITQPLADQFWGDYYGALTDKFGVQWMVNFNEG